ncbi:MAG: hypothetical protein Q9212_006240 [Teloschistes hypoglaucus]
MDQTSELYKSQIAHWNDDRVPELLAASVVLILATFVALTARFWAQRRIGKQWEADNILIAFAAILAVGVTVACIVAFQNGAGKHSIRVMAEDSDKPQQMVRILKAGYVISIVQGPCLGLIKVSILLFYRRIFTMLQRLFQITFYILGTFTLLVTLVTTLVFIIQCMPVRVFWEHAYHIANIQSPSLAKGHCLAVQEHIAATLIINTMVDIALLILPAIGLWNLSLPRSKKVGIFVAFSLGALYV